MTVFDAIKKRTSYRGEFEQIAIPRDDLIKIMEAGLAAPSGCNTQTTSLIAIDDKDLLKKLYDVIQPRVEKTATAMICVLTQETVAYRDGDKDVYFNVQDYSAAIQNMLLATVELGYETCWYEGQITDAEKKGREMANILGVPQDYELVCYLPIGVATNPIKFPTKKPFGERAWFNGFKKTE